MAYFLAIETATKNCSVALFKGSILLDHIDIEDGYTHAENIAPFVERLLAKNSISVDKIKAIAVSKGPGSYTGLRIGVAFAKGLCFAKNIPLIGINTLEAMSSAVINELNDSDAFYCPMLDARRNEVYTAVFNYELRETETTKALVLDEKSFNEILKKNKVYFFGDGSIKASRIINSSNANFLKNNYTSAKYFGDLIQKYFSSQKFADLAYFEPFYLKNFVAGKPKKLV